MDLKILEHYINVFSAWRMPLPNRPFHFVVEEIYAKKLREVYTYENRPSIGIDLLALTRYARANNKKPEDMSETEVAEFRKKGKMESREITASE